MRPGSDQNTPFEQGRFEDLPERPRLPHRYADAQSTTVVVRSEPFGDIATHAAFYGPRDAPPLLLIHGLMTTSYSWRYAFERLGDRFRLVVPDLPGAGRSAVAAAGRRYTAAALATFVGELQDAHDETLKSLEEAHEYGDPLASAAGARAFIGYLSDALDPRELRAFERELRSRRERGEGFPAAHARLRARGPDRAPEGRAPAGGAHPRRGVPLARAHLALRPGRPPRPPGRPARRLSRAPRLTRLA